MLIQRDWIKVNKLTYSNELDDYGQKRQVPPTSTEIEVIWKLYNQINVNNPNYVDVDVICLTKDTTINDTNQIVKDSVTYNILMIIPGKNYQVFLKKV